MTEFKLTTEKIVNIFGVELFRIELTTDCKWGKKGEKGGFIDTLKTPIWGCSGIWGYLG
jgi:hypothetical protein